MTWSTSLSLRLGLLAFMYRVSKLLTSKLDTEERKIVKLAKENLNVQANVWLKTADRESGLERSLTHSYRCRQVLPI